MTYRKPFNSTYKNFLFLRFDISFNSEMIIGLINKKEGDSHEIIFHSSDDDFIGSTSK